MKVLKKVSVILTMSVLMFGLYSFTMHTKEVKEPKGGNIGIYLKWSDGSAATGMKVRLLECNGDMGDSKEYTNSRGYVEIYNYDSYSACGIFANGNKYKKKMENGSSYTIYLN